MLMFTFVYDEQAPEPEKYDKLNIDEALFKRIGQNDMDAFNQLYRLTERTMYVFCLSIVKDHQGTLDLMQDTYVKVMAASHLYKPMGKPLAWMFTIAKNIYYSSLRRESRTTNLEPETIQDDKRFSYITDMDDKIVLQTVLDKLTEEEREIVLLYAVTGLKHKEIAESIGLSLSTTLSKYHRALKKLRGHLEEKEVRA